MAPKITLYLDIVSPFAYLSYHILKNSPIFAKCEITYIPIFLGGVMKACGNTPPIKIKNKDQWINKERLRWAKNFNIPMKETMPDGFPPLTLGVQRALCAITAHSPQHFTPCLDALYHSFWYDGNSKIGTPEGFKPVLEGVLGADGAAHIIAESTTPPIKELLNKNTEKAIEDGAFGLPWFVCTNEKGEKEGFWGVDHLGQVALFLGLDRGVDGGFRALL